MVKCNFCGVDIKKGTGKMFAKKDGTFYVFCSNKCDKNFLKLKRSAKKTKWTTVYAEHKGVKSKKKPAAKPEKKKEKPEQENGKAGKKEKKKTENDSTK